MKSYLIALVIALSVFSCDNNHGSIGYEHIELEEFIIDNYYNDALQLYMHELIQQPFNPDYKKSSINKEELVKILKLIQAVYNLNTPERDTIFEKHQIHGYYCYSLNSISLKVNTTLPEIMKLSSGIIPTGESSLDKLLSTYNFDSVRTFYSYPDFPWLTIYTKEQYNMLPVEKEFGKLSSVLVAEFNKGCIGDGSNISIERGNYSATITFSIGKGDCPAGCIYHKHWEFKVSNGIAWFTRTY